MNKFLIRTSVDEESFKVYLNGQQVGDADHDKNGWAGMEDVDKLVHHIAVVLGIPVEYEMEEE